MLIDSLFDEAHNAINMHALSATKANYRAKKMDEKMSNGIKLFVLTRKTELYSTHIFVSTKSSLIRKVSKKHSCILYMYVHMYVYIKYIYIVLYL